MAKKRNWKKQIIRDLRIELGTQKFEVHPGMPTGVAELEIVERAAQLRRTAEVYDDMHAETLRLQERNQELLQCIRRLSNERSIDEKEAAELNSQIRTLMAEVGTLRAKALPDHVTVNDLKRLRAADRAATPAPWTMATSNSWRRVVGPRHEEIVAPTTCAHDGHPDLTGTHADHNVLIEARNALPALLDEIESLLQRLRAVETLED